MLQAVLSSPFKNQPTQPMKSKPPKPPMGSVKSRPWPPPQHAQKTVPVGRPKPPTQPMKSRPWSPPQQKTVPVEQPKPATQSVKSRPWPPPPEDVLVGPKQLLHLAYPAHGVDSSTARRHIPYLCMGRFNGNGWVGQSFEPIGSVGFFCCGGVNTMGLVGQIKGLLWSHEHGLR